MFSTNCSPDVGDQRARQDKQHAKKNLTYRQPFVWTVDVLFPRDRNFQTCRQAFTESWDFVDFFLVVDRPLQLSAALLRI